MNSYIKLFRLHNVLMVGLTLFLMRYAIIAPILSVYSMELKLPFLAFLAYTLATMLVAAAGYAINDYYDKDLDLINRKKDNVIVGEKIPLQKVLWLYRGLNILAIILAAYASLKSGIFMLVVCYPIMIGLLYFYTTTYKKQFLIGNIIVSVASALVPGAAYLYEMPPVIRHYKYYIISGTLNMEVILGWILGFSIFAFLSSLAREIVKDMEDFEGDSLGGRNTVPIVWGIESARKISVSLISIIIAGIVFVYIAYFTNGGPDFITLSYFTAFLIIPFEVNIYHIWNAKEANDYKFCGDLLKIIMLMGILYAFVVWYMIHKNFA